MEQMTTTKTNEELFRAFVIEKLDYDPGPIRVTSGKSLVKFSTSNDPRDDSGWYAFRGETGVCGNWRDATGAKHKWSSGKKLSKEEQDELVELARDEDESRTELRLLGSIKARKAYKQFKFRTSEAHPYLERKDIKAPNLFIDKGELIIPLYTYKGKNLLLINYQRILQDGKKLYAAGAETGGFFIFGEIENRFILTEGFATGATLFETTGWPVVVAVNAHFLESVGRQLRKRYPKAEIVIAADDDVSEHSNHIGERKARRAAEVISAKIALPDFDRNIVPSDKSHSDWNDYARVNGKDKVKEKFFERAGVPSGDVNLPTPAVIEELNESFFFTNENGKCFIYEEMDEEDDDGSKLRSHSTEDFCKMFRNRTVFSEGKKVKLGEYWLDHPLRRQYLKGVIFDPRSRQKPGYYNLFRGLGVEPSSEGSWALLREHTFKVVCGSDEECFEYLMNWMARAVQLPWEKGETIVVLRGNEGSGKGVLGNALLKIFGEHALHITQAAQLVGQFNGHLRNKLYIFADEAFFAGDKKHVNALKATATEDMATYEFKHRNATRGVNYLHTLMASNETWVIPASENDRRFFVLDVKPTRVRELDYFEKLTDQLKDGGYEAMLHELLSRDITNFNVRKIPQTEALNDQKLLSMSIEDSWLHEILNRGYVLEAKGNAREFSVWDGVYSNKVLQASYAQYAKARGARYLATNSVLGKAISSYEGWVATKKTNVMLGERVNADGTSSVIMSAKGTQEHCYNFGTLKEARATFEKKHRRKFTWLDELVHDADAKAEAEKQQDQEDLPLDPPPF
jgi:phage/plasmid primase-like uncharacterized protein